MPGVDNFRDRLQIVEPQTTLQAVCKGDDSSCLGVFNQAADFFFQNGRRDKLYQMSRMLASSDSHTEFRI